MRAAAAAGGGPEESVAVGKSGGVSRIGSDHSPAPADMKSEANWFKVWGGIAGVQHTLPLLLTEAFHKGRQELPALVRQLSANVAERFKLPQHKGRIETGADADLALVNLHAGIFCGTRGVARPPPAQPVRGAPLARQSGPDTSARPNAFSRRQNRFKTHGPSDKTSAHMTRLFGSTRTVIKERYALLAPDSFVPSVLPGWSNAVSHLLISPAMGANFSQILITLSKQGRGAGRTGGRSCSLMCWTANAR